MATHELEALLAGLGLTRYLEEFQREMIDDACLDSLEAEDMRALGLPIGPRRKLEAALADRRRSRGAAAAGPVSRPVTPSPASSRPERAATLAAAAPLPAPSPRDAAALSAPPPHDAAGQTLWPTGQPGEGTVCEICMESAVAVRLECLGAHEFCVGCIDRWTRETVHKAQAHTTCPSCRAPVVRAIDIATGAPRPLAKLATAWGGAGTPAARTRQHMEALALADRRERADAAAALADRERVRREAAERLRAATAARVERERLATAARARATAQGRRARPTATRAQDPEARV